jgi:hypothetical protein
MREVMAKDKLTGRVSYRLGGQAFKQVERLAAAQNISTNEWCRQAVIEKLKSQSQAMTRAETGPGQAAARAEASQVQVLSRGEQILLEEIMRIRFLIYHGVQNHVGSRTGLTAEGWNYLIEQAGGGPQFHEIMRRWLEFYGLIKPRAGI